MTMDNYPTSPDLLSQSTPSDISTQENSSYQSGTPVYVESQISPVTIERQELGIVLQVLHRPEQIKTAASPAVLDYVKILNFQEADPFTTRVLNLSTGRESECLWQSLFPLPLDADCGCRYVADSCSCIREDFEAFKVK